MTILGVVYSLVENAPAHSEALKKLLDYIKELPPKVIAEFLVAAGGALSFWLGEHLARHWHKGFVRLKYWISGRKMILFWIDADITTARRLVNRLKKNFPFVNIRALNAPSEILHYPMRHSVVEAVVLISTDVTKLSSGNKVRREIEGCLEAYVLDGGGLVAGHDLIYKRTGNVWMREAFGVRSHKFSERSVPVQYEKTAAGRSHPIGRQLADSFSLEDGEVLGVSWTDGAEILFQEAGAADSLHGLVMAREHEGGRLVWLNSGDKGDELPKSIALPSDDYMALLTASIKWATKTKQLLRGAPLVAAHRGFTQAAGENTMAAFKAAIDLQADFIECDVRRTLDHALVLHHDPCIGDSPIASLPFAELEPLAVAEGRPLAKLDDLLALAKGRIGLDLELKESGYEEDIAAAIRKHDLAVESFVVTSFLDEALSKFKAAYPQGACGLLIGDRSWWKDWYPETRLRKCGADFVAAKDRLVRVGFARRLANKNFPVWVWTVNNPSRIARLLRTPGVEAVVTDVPLLAQSHQRLARRE